MEFQFKKHVKIVCDLEIGDKVRIKDYNYKLDGFDWTIEDIKFNPNSESSIMVKIDGYDSYLDSEWIEKIEPSVATDTLSTTIEEFKKMPYTQ